MAVLIAIKPPEDPAERARLSPLVQRIWKGKWVVPIHAVRQPGLGDLVRWLTWKTSLDRLAHLYERRTGRRCGCDRRQQQLNLATPARLRQILARLLARLGVSFADPQRPQRDPAAPP